MGASNLDVNISEGLRRAKKKKKVFLKCWTFLGTLVEKYEVKTIFREAFDSATTYSISMCVLWPAEFRPQGSTLS